MRFLHIAAALTSFALIVLITLDAYRFIDLSFLRTFTFSGNNLRSAILFISLMASILFWMQSITWKHFGYAIAFLFFLSLLVAGTYTSAPETLYITDSGQLKPVVLAGLSLLYIESMGRLKTAEKISKFARKIENSEPLALSKSYYGSNFLRFFKIRLAPSFVFLAFSGLLILIIFSPVYMIHAFDLSYISRYDLKFHLAAFAVLLFLIGIIVLNALIKKVYGALNVGELEKKVEIAKLYDELIRNENKKFKNFEFYHEIKEDKVFKRAAYISLIGLVIVLIGSYMNANVINEILINLENTIYNLDPGYINELLTT